jgi:hypothetical protein
MQEPPTVEISRSFKKWGLFNETQAICIEAEEDVSRVSSYLIKDADPAWYLEIEPPILIIPYKEFREILFFIPSFGDFPVFTNAFKSAGEPDKFIIKCFDGGDTQAGDELYIERSGYDYPRYKAVLKRAV